MNLQQHKQCNKCDKLFLAVAVGSVACGAFATPLRVFRSRDSHIQLKNPRERCNSLHLSAFFPNRLL
jgi:hypothetical protein